MSQKERLFNRNYILITLASLLMFTGFYLVMPIIAKYVVEAFDATPSTAGIVAASYIITALLTRPLSGYLVDKYDRRKFYLIAFISFSIFFTGYIISSSIAGLIITRILLGASFALVTTASNTLAIDVIPSSRRGDGIGYFGAIIVLAMAAGPMLGLYLIEIFTYRELFIFATMCSWAGVAIGSFVKTKPRESVIHQRFSLDRFFLREGASIATVISMMYFLYGTLMVYVALYISNCDIESNSGNFFLLFAIGIIISRVATGKALRLGRNDLIIKLGATITILSGVVFCTCLNDITLPITSILLGCGLGMSAPAVQSMMIELVPSQRRGTANSTYFIALDFGSGIGMLVGGTIAYIWSFQTLFAFGTALVAAALLLYLLYSRRNYNKHLAASREAISTQQ